MTCFYVDTNKVCFRVVPHVAMINFARHTTFTPVTEKVLAIPQNKFNFIEFDQLWARVNVNEVLSSNILNTLYYFNGIIP